MVSITASTRQPPAGDPKATVDLDGLLGELRQGDRAAFERYYRLFRAPVHHFAWRLLRDERAAVAATREALVGVFRRAILGDGVGDLEVLTYAGALALCEEHAGVAGAGGDPGTPATAAPAHRLHKHETTELMRRRFEGALDCLEPRQRAALLLHDLAGLGTARAAVVLGVGEEAAAALLFKAREEFRAALRERGGDVARGGCRQAEEGLTGAVGLGMSEDERLRLARHADYCRPCRKVMKGWAEAAAGLAVVLAEPRLPQALAAGPVFDDVPERPAAPPVHRRALAAAGRTLRGRAAAWAVAVACIALAGGVIAHGFGVQPLVLMQSVGPAIRLVVTSPVGEEPAVARPAGQSSARAAGQSSAEAPGTAVTSAAPAGAQSPAPVQSPAPGPPPSDDAPAPDATAAGQATGDRQVAQAESLAPPAPPSRTAAKAAAKAAKAAAKDARATARAARAATKAPAKAAAKAPVKAPAKAATKAATKAPAKAAAKAAAKASKANGRSAVAHTSASATAPAKAAGGSSKAARASSKPSRASSKPAKASSSKAKSAKPSAKPSTRPSARTTKSTSKSPGHKKGASSHGSKKGG